MTHLPEIDWTSVRAFLPVYESECWLTCNGGFCCSNNHPDFSFRFITKEGTDIIYLPLEFEFMQRHHKVPSQPKKVMELEFAPGHSVALVTFPCKHLGLCHGIIDKPLLCRMYPFIPVFDPSGEFDHLVEGSVFDVTFAAIGKASPCTVRLAGERYSRFYAALPDTSPLRHPYFIFYSRVVLHLANALRAGVTASQKLAGLSGKDFWKTWEFMYLAGMLFDWDILKASIRNDYQAVRAAFPDFDIRDEKQVLAALETTNA